jgi:hypothetical protein
MKTFGVSGGYRPNMTPCGTLPREDAGMATRSRHLTEWINRPAADVYEYVFDPTNLPNWAQGLGSAVEQVGEQWFVETGSGRLGVRFAERNRHGVLDHVLTMPTGEVVYAPMRVIPDGDTCEVIFTLRRQPGVTDDEFARDAALVQADLTRLKHLVEATP